MSNHGTVPLTITRAIAPLEPFDAPVALPEGITLDPGSSVHVRIVFAPTAAGPAHGQLHRSAAATAAAATVVALAGSGS